VKAPSKPLGSAAVDFHTYFNELLAKRGLKLVEFARLVGAMPQFVVSIRKGDRKLPPARVDRWADALGLKGAERRDFILIAMMPKCPEPVRPYLQKLIGQR
jgi:hypothetical protein